MHVLTDLRHPLCDPLWRLLTAARLVKPQQASFTHERMFAGLRKDRKTRSGNPLICRAEQQSLGHRDRRLSQTESNQVRRGSTRNVVKFGAPIANPADRNLGYLSSVEFNQ